MIQFRCTCGKAMQTQDEYAGKKARCPGCGQVVLVPLAPVPVAPHIAPGGPPQPPLPRAESREGFQTQRPLPLPPADDWQNAPQGRWDSEGRRRPAERRGMALWMKLLLVFIVVGVVAGGGWLLISLLGGGGSGAKALALVPRDGAGFATVRVADMWNSKGFEKLRGEFGGKIDDMIRAEVGLGIGDIDRVTIAVAEKNWEHFDRDFVPDIWGIVTTKVPVDKSKILNKLMRNHTENSAGGKTYYTSPETRGLAVHFASEKEVWLGAQPAIVGLLDGSRKISTSGALAESIEVAASDRHYLVVGFQMPERLREMMKEKAGGVPPELSALMDAQGGRITLEAGEAGKLEFRVQFGQEASAADLARLINDGVAKLKAEAGKMPPDAAMMMRAFDSLKVETRRKELIVSMGGADGALATMAALMVPAVSKVREAASRTQAANNMRQIMLAMHSYHDAQRRLPPNRTAKGLSWRVELLPYLDHGDLYRKFNLEEPWNSPHNIRLLDEMPSVYLPVGGPKLALGHTPYQVVVGERSLFHPVIDRRMTLSMVRDGTSNTVFVVESSRTVPWTAPDDVMYEPFSKKAPPSLGFQEPRDFLAGIGDGTVRWIPRRISQDLLDRLLCPDDGMVVPDDLIGP